MSSRTILVVLLAVICGAAAAVMAVQLRQRPGPVVESAGLPVVTAAADVVRGQVLEAKMVKLSHYRKEDLPKGALSAIDDVVGRTLMSSLVTGEPIVASKLTEKGAGRGLAAMIPDGMRAFTIQTPHVAADVGGFIMPGNHVDILLTTTPAGRNDVSGGGVTTTLLQNVQVLAVAQKTDVPEDSKLILNDIRAVTLLVTPNQAALLDLAMNRGTLHLDLRNPGDKSDARARPATMNDLSFHQEQPINLGAILSGLALALAQPAAPPAEAKHDEPPKNQVQQVSYTEIQTLRGLEAGTVRIALPR